MLTSGHVFDSRSWSGEISIDISHSMCCAANYHGTLLFDRISRRQLPAVVMDFFQML